MVPAPFIVVVDANVLFPLRRRLRGIWPPSKNSLWMFPGCRAFWPFWPRPAVLPRPEPGPRPLRFFGRTAPSGGASLERMGMFCSAIGLLHRDEVDNFLETSKWKHTQVRFLLPKLLPDVRTHRLICESFFFVLHSHTMMYITWPSASFSHAEIWRVLDLSGMTKSVRDSRAFVKAGYVYVNNVLVTTLGARVPIGQKFLLEIRFPNGVTKQNVVFITRPVRYKPRNNTPTTFYRKP